MPFIGVRGVSIYIDVRGNRTRVVFNSASTWVGLLVAALEYAYAQWLCVNFITAHRLNYKGSTCYVFTVASANLTPIDP